MRREPTKAEAILWRRLRGRKLGNLDFRRQHPIDQFIVDFYCPVAKLVIEVDGDVHDSLVLEDRTRQERLEGLGYRVIRFRNEEVLGNLESALQRIEDASRLKPG